jgi:homoaconitase/3-isopropylmalate dehydratase large subunit
MGMTITEKICARAAAKDRVGAGDMIDAAVDKLYIKDLRFSKAEDPKGLYGVFKEILKGVGITKAWDPDKIIINFDEQPARSTRRAEGQERAKQFAGEHGATIYEGYQGGIGHNVMLRQANLSSAPTRIPAPTAHSLASPPASVLPKPSECWQPEGSG